MYDTIYRASLLEFKQKKTSNNATLARKSFYYVFFPAIICLGDRVVNYALSDREDYPVE